MNYTNLTQMANPSFQHLINQSAVFHYLHVSGATYKNAIAQALGISLPSVTRALNALIERGFVEHTEYRKNKQSRVVPYYQATIQKSIIIAIDLLYCTIMGSGLTEKYPIQKCDFMAEESVVKSIKHYIDDYVENVMKRDITDIKSICIGSPGIVNVDKGYVETAIYHPNLEKIPLKAELSAHYHCSVRIENVVNLAAFANFCELAKAHSNIVACDVGAEIGAGLIINNSLYRGQNNIAGETGFFVDDLNKPDENYNVSCTLKSLNQKLIQSKLLTKTDTSLVEIEDSSFLQNIQTLFNLAHMGDYQAINLIMEHVKSIILMLNKIEILLNPEMIFIGGDICSINYTDELFLKPLNDLYEPIRKMKHPVYFSAYGRDTTLQGACAMGLELYLSQEFPYVLNSTSL